MRVFLCWSGTRSKAIASFLREWLADVIQGLKPWMSDQDISQGAEWFKAIGKQLHGTRAAIVCLTPENVANSSPWMLFESGAIYANRTDNMVCTYLLGIDNAAVAGPWSQFQATQANRDQTRKMLGDMNGLDDGPALDEKTLDRAFELQWPLLEKRIGEIMEMPVESGAATPERAASDKIDEILGVVRRLDRGQFGEK